MADEHLVRTAADEVAERLEIGHDPRSRRVSIQPDVAVTELVDRRVVGRGS